MTSCQKSNALATLVALKYLLKIDVLTTLITEILKILF